MRKLFAIGIILVALFSLACVQGTPEVAIINWRLDMVYPGYDEYLDILILISEEEKSQNVAEIQLQYEDNPSIWHVFPENWSVYNDPDSHGAWISFTIAKPDRGPFQAGLWSLTLKDITAKETKESLYIQRPPQFDPLADREDRDEYFPKMIAGSNGVTISASGPVIIRASVLGSDKLIVQEIDPGYYPWEVLEASRYMERDVLKHINISYNNIELGVTFTSQYDSQLQLVEDPTLQ